LKKNLKSFQLSFDAVVGACSAAVGSGGWFQPPHQTTVGASRPTAGPGAQSASSGPNRGPKKQELQAAPPKKKQILPSQKKQPAQPTQSNKIRSPSLQQLSGFFYIYFVKNFEK
jgi:hypothetical protein